MILFKLIYLFIWQLAYTSGHPVHNSDELKLSKEVSMPDLLKVAAIPANWVASEKVKLEEGRIVLTPEKNSKGSLWLKDSYKLQESFTLEWTFRSVNYFGKSKGGLSFWFIDSKTKDDQKLFNGPSTFDGVQLLVDNSSPMGSSVHAILDDGSVALDDKNIYDNSFASCLLSYQDSSVPSSARLTYDSNDNHLLKLQIDNKVCFQTRKIKLTKGSYSIGVTADNTDNLESFEILKMKFYNGVTSDSMIPNTKSMPQPKYLTKIVDKDTGKEKLVEQSQLDTENNKISNYDLYKKLDKVEGKILANDINNLETKLLSVIKVQQELSVSINQLSNLLSKQPLSESNKKSIQDTDTYKDFIAMNEKLEKAITEQERARETSKLQYHAGPQIDEILSKLFIWLLPLVLIMLVMAYYTYKIRQEIVKTKLL